MTEAVGVADRALVEAARAARAHAFAPYSGFAVGAALQLVSGDIVTGCNVENATYGLTLCAERVALVKAISQGARPGDFVAVAVVAGTDAPTPPCGACRQLLWEFCGDVPVWCAPVNGDAIGYTLGTLLPVPFDRSFLSGA